MAALMDGEGFDASGIDPQQSFQPLPVGKYKVIVTASDVRDTKTGSGQYVWLEMTVIDGEFEGRKIFDQINFRNQSQQAQDIGQRQLSGLCHAVGKLRVADTSEYHEIPFYADLKIQDDPKYGAKNRVAAYVPLNADTAPVSFKPGPAAPAQPQKSASGKPPWKKF